MSNAFDLKCSIHSYKKNLKGLIIQVFSISTSRH